ncbi:MAG: hypothetical protein NTW93_01105 [Phycisphaerae bacterium]|nr:hypothetical protein [Phycisphaerae bacterium]
MKRLKSASSISKIGLYSLLFISLCFVGGCVVAATPGQISTAKQQNILLGQGFSSAVYPVSLQQAMDVVAPVGAAHKAVCDREYILVVTGGKQNGQWIEKRPGMPPLESCQTITGYTGRWRFGEECKNKYYDVTITPFALKGQPENSAVKVVIDPVLTIWCTSADYDKYISLNQTFEEKLKVKCLPVQ